MKLRIFLIILFGLIVAGLLGSGLSSSVPAAALPLIIISVFAVAAVVIVRMVQKSKKRSMVDLAARLGLTPVDDDPLLPGVPFLRFLKRDAYASGLVGGRAVLVRNFTVGKQTFTGIDVRLGAGNALLLSVLKRNLLSKLFISTATKKFESGHAALDREFIFRSNMPEIAMAVVTTPDIRDALLSTQKQHGFSATIEVKPPFLHYQEAGSMTGGKRVARIQAVTLLMVQLAAALDAAASLVNSPRR